MTENVTGDLGSVIIDEKSIYKNGKIFNTTHFSEPVIVTLTSGLSFEN